VNIDESIDLKTINVIRRREQEAIIRNLEGNEVICTADEDLRARLQELTAGKGVERAIDCVAGKLRSAFGLAGLRQRWD
jgi:NADPH:quinone reductase-like Zn-dependent oxidoreductase